MNNLFILAVAGLLTFSLAAHAEGCTAKADVKSIWKVKEGLEDRGGAEYKVKFRVSSEDCKKDDCNGFILYDSRYVLENGRAYRHHHSIDYQIERGETSAEVEDDIIPGPTSQKLTIDGAYVTKIYCNTP